MDSVLPTTSSAVTMETTSQYDQLIISALSSRPVVLLKPLDWSTDTEILPIVDNSPNGTSPSKRIKIEPQDVLCTVFPTQAECDVGSSKLDDETDMAHVDLKPNDIEIHVPPSIEQNTTQSSFAKQHNDTLTGEKPYKCHQCDYHTSVKTRLKNHIATKHRENPYACMYDQCSFETETKDALKQHVKTHIQEGGYHTTGKTLLNNHVKTQHYKKPFTCDHCGFQTHAIIILNRHISTRHMITRNILNRHISTRLMITRSRLRYRIVVGENHYRCDQCDFQTLWHANLNKHISTHGSPESTIAPDTSEKSFKCDQCFFESSSEEGSAKHMDIHNKEKLQCDQCVYQTWWLPDLAKHVTSHTGVKPYKCDQCDFQTFWHPNITHHMRAHTNLPARPSCLIQQCNYPTTVGTNLDGIRNMTHTGVSYKCNQCDYQTYLVVNLTRHIQTHSNLQANPRTYFGETRKHPDSDEFDSIATLPCFSNKLREFRPREVPMCNSDNKFKLPHILNSYECKQCDYKTSDKDKMEVHSIIHRKRRTIHPIEHCVFETEWSEDLQLHVIMHAGEKSFKCI